MLLSDFKRDVVSFPSVPETTVIFFFFLRTQPSQAFIENGLKKRKYTGSPFP